jgi:hypothetical protein
MSHISQKITPEIEATVRAVAIRFGQFTDIMLQAQSGPFTWAVVRLLNSWQKEGLIKFTSKRMGDRMLYVWVGSDDAPDQANLPDTGTVNGNLWRSMLYWRTFTPVDLMAVSSTSHVKISVEVARAYCQLLMRAGYLRVEIKAKPGINEASYRLIKDTGPLPPFARKVTAVFDPNENRIVFTTGGLS